MGRSKSRRGRVTSVNARRSLPLESYIPSPFDLSRQMKFGFLQSIEDRRTWHPEGPQRPARGLLRARHRLTLAQPSKKFRGPTKATIDAPVGFDDPFRVVVCVRRRRRREVLHAFRKTGRRGQRRPRRSWYSDISCGRKKTR